MPDPNPSYIMQVGLGFFASKTLLSAVELGLFTELSKQAMTGAEIARALDLCPAPCRISRTRSLRSVF
jgi:hypothetical protein